MLLYAFVFVETLVRLFEESRWTPPQHKAPPSHKLVGAQHADTAQVSMVRFPCGRAATRCIMQQLGALFPPVPAQNTDAAVDRGALRHLRYQLTEVPPHPNSPPDKVFHTDQQSKEITLNPKLVVIQASV